MSDVTVTFGARDAGLSSAINAVGKQMKGMQDSFGKVAAAGAAIYGAFIGVKESLSFVSSAIESASSLGETQSKVTQIFKESSQAIFDWSETAAKSLGQSKQQAMDGAATFAIFGKSAGLSGADLVDFSKELVGLAADLASFNNTSPEDAITAIGAALRGESEPIRRYGVLLDDATLRNEALTLGITDSIQKALTPQQRVLAAQSAILKQTSTQQGDFARTSEGMANQTRILSAQWADLTTKIGEGFLPAANDAIIAINKMDFAKAGEDVANLTRGIADLSVGLAKMGVNKDILLPIFIPPQTLWALRKIQDIGATSRRMDAELEKEKKDGPSQLDGPAIEGDKASEQNTFGVLKSQQLKELISDTKELGSSLNLLDDAMGNPEAKLGNMDVLFTDMNAATEAIIPQFQQFETHLGGAVDQQEILNKLIDDASLSEEELAKRAERKRDAEVDALNALKSQASQRAQAAKDQLSTIAGADVPAIGERGARSRAARKALELENKAAIEEAFGSSDKAKQLRDKASKLRGRAFGDGKDYQGSAEQSLKSIDSRLEELNKKLPTPALAP